ncbi:MAG TPA: BCCT family transporter [Candidatus Anaerostipes excrementavium]|uniref:BCCT family transporter n=1 Tax=Candidatus Anaerostipes excrementavium TaxID=2838463 RepID=A0A9D2B8E8_9FIRM|nr:BCCT family transporter [uncultured Anaerostipes sp.]HIX66778.1 BCCT family transporter [Candidatus Anaerostipes excrementavium]
MRKDDKKINKWAFWPAIVILIGFILAGIIWTEQVGAIMTKLLYAMADYFGAYINILSLVFIVLCVVFIISRYGDVVIGGENAKPEYNMASWCAMSICSGIGTGLLFWAMGEPIFHYMSTPMAIGEAGTRRAGIFAVAQAMWDWSFVQYSMYAICGAAFAIICYNRKKSLSFNSIVECVTGKKIKWLNTLVTAIVIFCLMGATSNSMGVGLMQIGAGLEAALGIPQSALSWLGAAIFVTVIFVLSCVSGIGKGLKLISSACMYFFFFLLAYVFIFGNTQFITKITSESIGFLVDNFGTMTTMTNVMTNNEKWFADWIVQYWASFIVYAPVIGMFLARMGRGRKVRTFMLVQILVPSIFCIVWIGIFGGQTIFLQTSGTLDVWSAVNELGMQATVFQILNTLPFGKVITLLFLCTVTLSFCTLADPMSSVAATLSVNNISADDEPPKKQKVLVGCILGGTAYTLVATGGINSVKGLFTLVGLLQSIVLIMCAVVLFKYGKKCYYLPNSGYIQDKKESTDKKSFEDKRED